jgi:hypothetical protein
MSNNKFFGFQLQIPDGSTYSAYDFAPTESEAREKVSKLLRGEEKIVRFFEIPHELAVKLSGVSDNDEIEKLLGL